MSSGPQIAGGDAGFWDLEKCPLDEEGSAIFPVSMGLLVANWLAQGVLPRVLRREGTRLVVQPEVGLSEAMTNFRNEASAALRGVNCSS